MPFEGNGFVTVGSFGLSRKVLKHQRRDMTDPKVCAVGTHSLDTKIAPISPGGHQGNHKPFAKYLPAFGHLIREDRRSLGDCWITLSVPKGQSFFSSS